MNKDIIASLAESSRSWAFEEARKVLARVGGKTPAKGYVLFETGYGPSGLPHIGTYMEVVRTKMVQNAFAQLSDIPTKLFVVSDDMDGLRKVPPNLPNQEALERALQLPLTSVPDPFGQCASYGDYMNSKLIEFLKPFGFEYEFKSATQLYRSGALDEYLLRALAQYDKIMDVMLPSLGEERQRTYSPFLPICPETGKVLYVPVIERNVAAGTIVYVDERTNKPVTVPVTGGRCKLQWKPDFGVRWAALGVDFEMYGKDHLANGPIYSRICEIVGGQPPEQFFYELFLDEEGKKISKSKGNGISVEQWLRYAPIESLAYYMYQSPRKAKKLYFSVIPKSVDDYLTCVEKFHAAQRETITSPLVGEVGERSETGEGSADKYPSPAPSSLLSRSSAGSTSPTRGEVTCASVWDNPAAHIHNFKVPSYNLHDITFSLLINIVNACNPTDKSVLLGFIKRYSPDIDCSDDSFVAHLAEYAMNYYHDFVKPNKQYREPTEDEHRAIETVAARLRALPAGCSASEAQKVFYDTALEFGGQENMRAFFSMLYQVLLGQAEGPRLGSFVVLYGVDRTLALIEERLEG